MCSKHSYNVGCIYKYVLSQSGGVKLRVNDPENPSTILNTNYILYNIILMYLLLVLLGDEFDIFFYTWRIVPYPACCRRPFFCIYPNLGRPHRICKSK